MLFLYVHFGFLRYFKVSGGQVEQIRIWDGAVLVGEEVVGSVVVCKVLVWFVFGWAADLVGFYIVNGVLHWAGFIPV